VAVEIFRTFFRGTKLAMMPTGTTLHTKTSSFFDHRDPEIVRWLGMRELDV
jgi:hypothetical protein